MHIKKLTRSESIKIIGHDYRRHGNYKNEDIDLSKSKDNVIFKNVKGFNDITKYIDKNDIYVYGKNGKKKDEINYLCSLVVHYPKECCIDENTFFNCINELLKGKFCHNNNYMGSIVHYDEKSPHLHFLFVPVCQDKKNNRLKLCAKEVITRDVLKSLHTDIEKDFKDIYGYDVKLTLDEKVKGIKNIENIEEYKKYKDLQKENELLKIENETLKKRNEELELKNKSFGSAFENSSIDDLITLGRF